jgi:hypothetical protein
MRWTAILVAGCVVPLVGCHLTQTAAHNLMNEPIEYLDGKKLTRRLRAEGLEVLRSQADLCNSSEDYSDGFVDGYADYLEYGGNNAPPAVPPLKYRRSKFLSPEGHARIHEYFTGFHAGSDSAARSGRRQFLTVPVLMANPQTAQPANVRQVPADQCAPNKNNCPAPAQPVFALPATSSTTTTPPATTTTAPPPPASNQAPSGDAAPKTNLPKAPTAEEKLPDGNTPPAPPKTSSLMMPPNLPPITIPITTPGTSPSIDKLPPVLIPKPTK